MPHWHAIKSCSHFVFSVHCMFLNTETLSLCLLSDVDLSYLSLSGVSVAKFSRKSSCSITTLPNACVCLVCLSSGCVWVSMHVYLSTHDSNEGEQAISHGGEEYSSVNHQQSSLLHSPPNQPGSSCHCLFSEGFLW